MNEPPLKTILYWCPACNVPLLGEHCGCGASGQPIPLLRPYDVRPVLRHDRTLIARLLSERFGNDALPQIVLLNKTGGIDRKDLIIAHGRRFGWLSFDPERRSYSLDITFEALPFILPHASRGTVDISEIIRKQRGKRIGGKRFPVETDEPDGTVILIAGDRAGIGVLRDGYLRVRQMGRVASETMPDPAWDDAIKLNKRHLKNLERNAVRFIRSQIKPDIRINVAFSGGKDSTAVLELARRAGVHDAFFVDTGLEFPETRSFVGSKELPVILNSEDFWQEVKKRGPPRKDDRWCCEFLKLAPVMKWLAGGRCVTIQGNRWYESFSRAGLSAIEKNPFNPRQLNVSPIRSWRALEVFLYIWWRNLACNPLYEMGMERIGCWMCPAMMESEWERVRAIHPELAQRWLGYLSKWADRNNLPSDFIRCGVWRWKNLPPKMVKFAQSGNISGKL